MAEVGCREAHDLHDGLEDSHEGDGEFSTDLYTRKAVQVIHQHNTSAPLFLYLAFQAPHMNIQRPPDHHLSRYRRPFGRPCSCKNRLHC